MNPFHQLLLRSGNQRPLGTWLMSASPLVAEAVGHAGFDWGVIDMEHSPVDLMELVHMLQAIGGTRMVPVVRVPWNDAVTFKRVLDAGAHTLLVPFVQNADEARHAVAATRYPPQGVRGMAAMGRASRFGTAPDHFGSANRTVSVIVQLETREAVNRLEEIAAVEGVDALFLGPADLSGSMGHVGQLTHPAVMELMSQAVRRCKAVGKPVGTVGGSADVVTQYRAMGFDYLAIGSDLGLMMRACQGAVSALTAQDTEHVHDLAAGTLPQQGY
jgi:2-keto-3-deoxy-L-rhamnonate aldolase RhmA